MGQILFQLMCSGIQLGLSRLVQRAHLFQLNVMHLRSLSWKCLKPGNVLLALRSKSRDVLALESLRGLSLGLKGNKERL